VPSGAVTLTGESALSVCRAACFSANCTRKSLSSWTCRRRSSASFACRRSCQQRGFAQCLVAVSVLQPVVWTGAAERLSSVATGFAGLATAVVTGFAVLPVTAVSGFAGHVAFHAAFV